MMTQESRPLQLNAGSATGQVGQPIISDSNPDQYGFVKQWPSHPRDVSISMWDHGVYIAELLKRDWLQPGSLMLTPQEREEARANPGILLAKAAQFAPPPIQHGTYRSTQLALTKHYDLIEQKYNHYMDAGNFEPTVPTNLPLSKKKQFYVFSTPEQDQFPPHLNLALKIKDPQPQDAPAQNSAANPGAMFNKMRLPQLINLLPSLIPKTIKGDGVTNGGFAPFADFTKIGTPDEGKTIADIERFNSNERKKTGPFARNDIFNLPNIGDLPDWFTDERFAQQHFTGTNPTTIELASDFWINHFIDNATEPSEQIMKDKIARLSLDEKQRRRLYMQDYSYFREAAGVNASSIISCPIPEIERSDRPEQRGRPEQSYRRYGVASVCLFHLNEEDKLQPLAIVIDWRGSAANSVTIYNKELPIADQAVDWPWRYAKTCVQTSDWLRHEVTVHLINTHLVEEAVIVAAQQCFENDHPVLQILYPHWQKTLSRNAAARDSLVPQVIIALIGLEKEQAQKFILEEYNNFDFQGYYVPNDLRRRGFDPEELYTNKYRNYAYARCIYSMWWKIRDYVNNTLCLYYKSDEDVAKDIYIKEWYQTMQKPPAAVNGGANLKTFPTITTYEGLVDAITMCIHLASPQHTAVNYLQNYYQGFVINKPACLYTPPPTSKAELYGYNEQNVVDALPINHTREWLLASHIPYLLSLKPGDKESLIQFAASKWHMYQYKTNEEEPHAEEIREAALKFFIALSESETEFAQYGRDTFDSNVIAYDVLSPSWNAVSILI